MLLSEIFDHLTYGELSQLAIGTSDSGVIAVADYPKLVSYLNMALLTLHTRFPLVEKQLVIQEYDHITLYPLHYKYAQSNTESTETYKYISDTEANPYLGDALKISEVFNELGESLPLNDSNDDDSLFTPQPITLQIPEPVGTNATIVLYRANHPIVIADGIDPTTEEINLPYQLLEALLFYIAYRVQSGKAAGAPGDINFLTKFENAVAQAKLDGHLIVENNSNIRLENNGWV